MTKSYTIKDMFYIIHTYLYILLFV